MTFPNDAERRALTDICMHEGLHKACDRCSDIIFDVTEALRGHVAAREAQAAAKVEAERDDLLEQRDDLYESLAARTKDVNRMLAEREQHDLANGGCVPAPAYRDLAAEYHRERATVARVEALADEWEATLSVAQWRRQAARRLRKAMAGESDG